MAQVGDGHLAQRVQIVVAVAEDALHQVDGALLGAARTNQDGQQFCVRQGFWSLVHEFLAGTILLSPLIDVQLL
jgi:hypothetical protein